MIDLDQTERRTQATGTVIAKVVEQIQREENEWFRLAGGHTGPIGDALDAARLRLVEAGIQLRLVSLLVAELRAAREAAAIIPPDRLRLLADWLDIHDDLQQHDGVREVQDDLRRLAAAYDKVTGGK